MAREVTTGLHIRAHFALNQEGYAFDNVAGYQFLLGEDAEQFRPDIEDLRRTSKELTGRDFDETAFVVVAARYFLKKGKNKP